VDWWALTAMALHRVAQSLRWLRSRLARTRVALAPHARTAGGWVRSAVRRARSGLAGTRSRLARTRVALAPHARSAGGRVRSAVRRVLTALPPRGQDTRVRASVLVAVVVLGLVAVLVGEEPPSPGTTTAARGALGTGPTSAGPLTPGTGPPTTTTPTLAELPRGGRTVFPRYRLVGFSGGPGTAAFGRLGVGRIDARGREIERLGRRYDGDGREVLPVFELIAVVALDRPGRDGKYRARIDDKVIAKYLAAARRHRALLLLNVQPGRADFLREVKALERWLREPDVGLALDPEWAVGPRQVPGRVFGSATGAELKPVVRWVGEFTRRENLPQKVVVVHRLIPRVVRRPGGIGHHSKVAVVFSADGIGPRTAKVATWKRVVRDLPSSAHPGFKLFYEEDTRGGAKLMTPRQVLRLRPRPEYVLYE
jgi:hypothetical protein